MNRSDLLHKLSRGEATPEELEAFYAHLSTLGPGEYSQLMDEYGEVVKGVGDAGPSDKQLLAAIIDRLPDEAGEKRPLIRRIYYYAAAAAVLAGLLIGSLFLFKKAPIQPVAQRVQPLPSNVDKVILATGGRKIILDSAGRHDIAKLIAGNKTVNENTLTTPRGAQYDLTLPDGTHVWLNAASSLRFPTAFGGKERKVELTGEAYFAVARDVAHPFVVDFHEAEVRVLGTEFNVMAYADEPVSQTTLVQGRIRLDNEHDRTLLEPGKMAIIGDTAGSIAVRGANVDAVTAWKNGQLSLSDADLSVVMREISRWYDVNIYYKGPVPHGRFFGLVNRNVPLPTILEFLRENGIHVQLSGRDITVFSQ